MNHYLKKRTHISDIMISFCILLGSFLLFSIVFGINKNTRASTFPIKKSSSVEIINTISFEKKSLENDTKYILQKLEQLGIIEAESFLVGDIDTGEVIFQRKPYVKYPIASITKYMTAYTTANYLPLNEFSHITKDILTATEGNRAKLKERDLLTLRELLYPLLIVSSNDAGEIIAQHKDREKFIQHMNDLTQQKEMYNTSFKDPTGLSQENISTAQDLFKMMRSIRKDYPYIVQASRLSFKKFNGYLWRNINQESKSPYFRGGKTGYTHAAKQTSIGYYQITLANNQIKNIGIIILKSNKRKEDTKHILNYLKRYVAYL